MISSDSLNVLILLDLAIDKFGDFFANTIGIGTVTGNQVDSLGLVSGPQLVIVLAVLDVFDALSNIIQFITYFSGYIK